MIFHNPDTVYVSVMVFVLLAAASIAFAVASLHGARGGTITR